MQLTTFTDYGLRCLMYLAARPGRLSSVKEISEYYVISRNHLVKVVHRLAQLGYVDSSKGKGGGIKLAKNPETIRLGDVVEQLEPNMEMVECFNQQTNCCRITDACQLKSYLFEAERSFLDTLNQYTLADTVSSQALLQMFSQTER
jgi:Rrf2 family transcriptional regulator, nitric oxide-sensitive transcriptional repressor